MNKLITPVLSLLGPASLLLIFTGCSKPTSRQAENSLAFDSVKAPAYSGSTVVGVTHSVKNYEEWLKVYNEDSDPDSRISIYRSPDDPNLITVFELTKSHADARNLYASARLKQVMMERGVTSEPVYAYYDMKYRASDKTDKLYRLGVTHKVADYERWKQEFDKEEPIRAEAGLELRAISTNADDPSIVNVMFATDDIDKAKNLINSDELKKRMDEAGVESKPSFTVFKVVSNP